MYSARVHSPRAVDVYDSNNWCRLKEITGGIYRPQALHVTDERILVCCSDNRKLYAINHSGELLQIYGRSKREATDDDIIEHTRFGEPVYGPGVLDNPCLCQVDDDGSALVAEKFENILKVMRADGTWSVVQIHQALSRPKGAVWCNASLYIANNGNIVRFS